MTEIGQQINKSTELYFGVSVFFLLIFFFYCLAFHSQGELSRRIKQQVVDALQVIQGVVTHWHTQVTSFLILLLICTLFE